MHLLLLLLSCRDPQVAPEAPLPGPERALVALEAQSATPLDPVVEGAAVRWLGMDVALPPGEDLVEQSLAFFDEHRAVYGLTDPYQELALAALSGEEGRDHVRYVQLLAGLPVYGSFLALHTEGGRVKATNGRYRPRASLSTLPTLDWDVALRRLAGEGWGPLGEPALVVFDPGLFDQQGDPVLAWSGRAALDGAPHQLLLDAHTGEVLLVEADQHTWDLDLETGNRDWSDTCWFWTTSDDDWYDEDGPNGYPGGSADPFGDGPEGYDAIKFAFDWYLGRFGRESWDNDDEEIEMYVRVAFNPPVNASWNRGCEQLYFDNSLAVRDVTVHEYTHAVIYDTSGLIYAFQSGALNEALSDLMAALSTGDWVIGEQAETIGPSGLRDLSDPARFGMPTQLSGYVNLPQSNDSGGVHTNSSIPALAVARMVDPPPPGDIGGLQIPGLSAEEASCLTYVVMVHVLGPSSGFADYRWAMLGAARNHECNIAGSAAQQCSIINGFASVGVGSADTDCDGLVDLTEDSDTDGDGVQDSFDNCVLVKNTGQFNADKDGQGDACDDDDDNDGLPDIVDLCPWTWAADNSDSDGDKVGDACDDNDDHDGLPWAVDNCPQAANVTQTDHDGDGWGDACDPDDDNDGVFDNSDNCDVVPNPDQAEGDGDGVGDACDVCPTVPDESQVDCDQDGVGEACALPGSREEASEQHCQWVHAAQTIEAHVDRILPQGSGPVPLPECLACGAWVNPADRLQVVVQGVTRQSRWIVRDQDGRVVAHAPPVGRDLTATMLLDPGPLSRYTLGDGTVFSARSYFLENVTEGQTDPPVTLSVQAAP